jgi:hypothetical protein
LDCVSSAQAPKTTAIILRRHAISSYECAAHAFIIAKTGPTRDDLYGVMRRLEKASGCFSAELLNGPRRAFPGLANIDTSEVAWAHLRRFCQRGNRQVCIEIGADPVMEIAESAARVTHTRCRLGDITDSVIW